MIWDTYKGQINKNKKINKQNHNSNKKNIYIHRVNPTGCVFTAEAEM